MKRITGTLIMMIFYLFCSVCLAAPINSHVGNANVANQLDAFKLKSKPNLHIFPINFSKSKLVVGQAFDIIVTVKNSSGFSLSTDSGGVGITSADKYGPSRHHVGSSGSSRNVRIPGTATTPTELTLKIGNGPSATFQVPALAPGQTVTFKKSYTATKAGNLTISCTVDPRNLVKEANEHDNTQRKVVRILGLPDFKIVRFYVTPSSIRVNDEMTIHAVIKNFGESGAATSMRFDIHGDISGAQDVVLHQEVNVPFLDAGQKTTVTYQFTPRQAGTYTLGGGVNTPARTPESNTINNSVPRLLRVQVKPAGIDLALVAINTKHKKRRWYQNFRITVVVKNIGNQPSGPFNVHFYRPYDKGALTAQGTWKDMKQSCPSLAPNQMCRKTFVFQYKIYLGEFTAYSKVDPERKVNDINRTNNSRTIRLKVANL